MSLHLEVILFLLLSSVYLHKVNHHTVVLIEEFIDESSPVDEACETFQVPLWTSVTHSYRPEMF